MRDESLKYIIDYTKDKNMKYMLNLLRAGLYADNNSICIKVPVGSLYVGEDGTEIFASNNGGGHGENIDCKKSGKCHKAEVTGIFISCEETRPFCASKHSEVRLIDKIDEEYPELDVSRGTVYVSRYPCIDCMTHLAERGFKEVVYGGVQEISDEVYSKAKEYGIKVYWFPKIDNEPNREKNVAPGT